MIHENNIETGSGNIFADLDLPDAEVLQMKAYLSLCIEREIRTRNLTQVEAAKILGLRQPKLSALLSGGFDAFTLDRLIRYLVRLDQEVTVTVHHPAS